MSATKRVLCIGGPLDGKTVPDEGLTQFQAIAAKATAFAAAMSLPKRDESVSPVSYRLRWISCEGKEAIRFYTADGITEHGAIVRVFSAYTKGNANGR